MILVSGVCKPGLGQEEACLSVSISPQNEIVIVIGADIHARYGFAYPMTYQIGIPPGSTGLEVNRRYSSAGSWTLLSEKSPTDFFNAIETVRIDYGNDVAYVSAAFESNSDSLFIRLTTPGGVAVTPSYWGISRYYDNRRAAVTITGDDCAEWTRAWFPSILNCFRSYQLYVTAAVITGQAWCLPATWWDFQQQLDLGYVELASHSRTHSYIPYADYVGEVVGSAEDIINNVQLPRLFRSGTREYVYVWVAPYGNYDAIIDSLVGVCDYLVPRLYATLGDTTFSAWDSFRDHFAPINLTVEIGAPSWGGGETDTTVLNATFDMIAEQGGVYHLMWHAQVVHDDLDKTYFKSHLGHISGRRDIWYVNLGHLYLYHLLQMVNSPASTGVIAENGRPTSIQLLQNYPNPFNPSTNINYQLPVAKDIKLVVFDVLGKEVATLVDGVEEPGYKSVKWDASGVASGMYFYRLQAGEFVQTRKLLLLR
jgi:hypothetical protein